MVRNKILVRVSEDYRIHIPEELREKIGVKPGDYLAFYFDEEEGVIKIKPHGRKRATVKIRRRITEDDIEGGVEEVLDEITG